MLQRSISGGQPLERMRGMLRRRMLLGKLLNGSRRWCSHGADLVCETVKPKLPTYGKASIVLSKRSRDPPPCFRKACPRGTKSKSKRFCCKGAQSQAVNIRLRFGSWFRLQFERSSKHEYANPERVEGIAGLLRSVLVVLLPTIRRIFLEEFWERWRHWAKGTRDKDPEW